MKKKTLFNQLNAIFAGMLLVAVIFCSCSSKNVMVEETSTTINSRKIKIYIIDSCEYIGSIQGGNGDMVTHKGNCKFCADRCR